MGGTGHHGGLVMGDTVLVFGDARSVKPMLSQKANPKPTLGCTITLMESGHHGMLDTVDTVLPFGDVRSVKLHQKANLKLTLGCTITPTEYGHHGTQDTTDTVLVFGDARSVKPNQYLKLMPKPKPTTSLTEYGQPGTLDTTVSTDGNGVMPLANLFFHPPKYRHCQILMQNQLFKIKAVSSFQLAKSFQFRNQKNLVANSSTGHYYPCDT